MHLGLFSNKLNKVQHKNPTAGKELLDLGKGCQCFENAVRRGEVVTHSDHKKINFSDKTKHTSQRKFQAQARAKCDYRADVACVNGEGNLGVDGLSRLGAKAKDLKDDEEMIMIRKLNSSEEKSK